MVTGWVKAGLEPPFTETCHGEQGAWLRVWLCPVPGAGVTFRVIRCEWTGDVQYIHEIEET